MLKLVKTILKSFYTGSHLKLGEKVTLKLYKHALNKTCC